MEGEKSVRKSELPPFSGAKLHSHLRSHAERSEVGLTFAPKNGGNSDLKLKLKQRQLPFSRLLSFSNLCYLGKLSAVDLTLKPVK